MQDDYNTQRSSMVIAEYGRHVHDYVKYIQSLSDRDKRTSTAEAVIQIMAVLNPEVKQQSNYKETLWEHLYQMADYDLDVDCPYAMPTREERNQKPGSIGYPDSVIKFRFYGRNLQNMVDKAAEMEDPELRQGLVNLIASFMYNSCKSWNNENLSNETIAEHLKTLSKGKLNLAGDQLVVSQDNSPQKKFFNRNKSNNNNNNNRNKNNKFNRNKGGGGGYRRY
ncbi:MAG: DUF4290 domain-containing protein [Bacteroidetes bacterium]|nr:DUF4290 domain-containing protein [Bacteroidota bacterium]